MLTVVHILAIKLYITLLEKLKMCISCFSVSLYDKSLITKFLKI